MEKGNMREPFQFIWFSLECIWDELRWRWGVFRGKWPPGEWDR
jgi:hypothetical protein